MYDLVVEGKIVDPLNGVRETRIGIRGERIEAIGGNLDGKRVIAVNGYVFPGFVDPHVHLRGFDWAYKEDFVTGTRAAINGGVTTVADMPNLPKPTTTRSRVLEKIERAKAAAEADVVFYGGVTVDNLGMLEEMQDAVCGYKIYVCESTGNLYLPPGYLFEAFRRVENTGKPVTVHCEDQSIIDKVEMPLRGMEYAHKHCDVRPAISEISSIGKVLYIASDFGIKINIAHLSTAGGLELKKKYQAKAKARITCEVAPHHLYFTSDDMRLYDAVLQMNPPLRSKADRKELLDCLSDGSIEMLATDHAPHTLDEKRSKNPSSGVPGLDDYGRFVSWLIEKGIKPQRIAQVASYNPAQFLGLSDRGRIVEGFLADLAIIEFDGDDQPLYTKCQWSPYENEIFPGKVSYTIRKGKIVKEKGKLLDKNLF